KSHSRQKCKAEFDTHSLLAGARRRPGGEFEFEQSGGGDRSFLCHHSRQHRQRDSVRDRSCNGFGDHSRERTAGIARYHREYHRDRSGNDRASHEHFGGSWPIDRAVRFTSLARTPGGVTLSLTSSDPSKVTIVPATIVIASGLSGPVTPPQLNGL